MVPWAGLERRCRESGRRHYELRRPVRDLVQPGNDKGVTIRPWQWKETQRLKSDRTAWWQKFRMKRGKRDRCHLSLELQRPGRW